MKMSVKQKTNVMGMRKLGYVLVFATSLTMILSCGQRKGEKAPVSAGADETEIVWPLGFATDTLQVDTLKVRDGQTLSKLFTGLGLSDKAAYDLVQASDSIFPAKALRSGRDCFAYTADTLGLRYLVYEKDRVKSVVLRCVQP